MAGVYTIQSISYPERVYVGSCSKKNVNDRWNSHLCDLKKNKHASGKLQNHFNKYGKDDLKFSILEDGEYLCKQHLLSREQGWFTHFKYLNNYLPYFNCTPIAGSCLGIKRSAETNEKNRQKTLGKHWKLSDATKIKMSKPKSDTTKSLMSIAQIGNKKALDKHGCLGFKHTEETKAKHRNISDDVRKNISFSLKRMHILRRITERRLKIGKICS